MNGFLSPKDFYRIASVHSPEYFTFVPVYSEEEKVPKLNKTKEERKESSEDNGEAVNILSKNPSLMDMVSRQLSGATDVLSRGAQTIR